MKIITWNCKMAYRNKSKLLLKYHSDVIVVQESEKFESNKKQLWFGENKNKGIGISSNSDYNLKLDSSYNPLFRYVIPINVSGKSNFNLLAIWAMNDAKNRKLRYIGQVFSAISYYKNFLEGPIIIIGDFNWNVYWDKKPDYPLVGNFNDTQMLLQNKGILSAYHKFTGEEFGDESKPTFFMHHKKNKAYHIDYCFVSKNFKIKNLEIGKYEDWIKSSDHVPLVVDFEDLKI